MCVYTSCGGGPRLVSIHTHIYVCIFTYKKTLNIKKVSLKTKKPNIQNIAKKSNTSASL
jgi:hypothetical protein